MGAGVEYVATPTDWAPRETGLERALPTVKDVVEVVGATLLAGVALALLTTSIVIPTIFGDELRYWEAARSFANGDGLSIRGGPYGYGPVYPMLLSPIVGQISPPDAYLVAKLLNAVLFALAVIPVYFLARRVLDHSWSIVVALLSVFGPAAVYSGFVLTESAAFLACSLTLLAMVCAVQRPSTGRQLAALGTIGVATATRPQLAVLGVALIAAYGLSIWTRRGQERRAFLAALRPTIVLAAAAAVVAVFKAFTDGASALGGYADVASGDVSILAALVWTWWTAGALVLTLAAVPAFVFPTVVTDVLRRRLPAGSSEAAFSVVVVSVTLVMLFSVGFFSSTPESLQIIHERYFFYLVPLWLIAISASAQSGRVWTYRQLVVGALLAFVLVSTLPPGLRKINSTLSFEWPSGLPWFILDRLTPVGGMAFSAVAAALVTTLAIVAMRASRRWPMVVLVPTACFFGVASMMIWAERSAISHLDQDAYGATSAVPWVDEALGAHADVITLFPGSKRCDRLYWKRPMLYTEFDNESIRGAVHLRNASAPVIASTAGVVDERGVVRDVGWRPVEASFVIAPRGTVLAGRKVSTGYDGLVTLWSVRGSVRILGASSTATALKGPCPASAER